MTSQSEDRGSAELPQNHREGPLLTSACVCVWSGLSVERPCARSVKVDCPCVFSQVCVRGGVVWALSEHKALFYREGVTSFCSEGDDWKYDTVR